MISPALRGFVALLSLLASVAHGHFTMKIPPSIGFADSQEGLAPCGGFEPAKGTATLTNFPVAGHPLSMLSTHPEAHWAMKIGVLNGGGTVAFEPWLPQIDQTGLGTFCLPQARVPDKYIGHEALIQIVQDAVDGKLYQCCAVRFVAGGPAPLPPACQNSTGVSAVWATAPRPSETSDEPPIASNDHFLPHAPDGSNSVPGGGSKSSGGSKVLVSSALNSLGATITGLAIVLPLITCLF